MRFKLLLVFLILASLILWVYQHQLKQPKILMGYWYPGNTKIIYPIPGSFSDSGKVVDNKELQDQLQKLNILVYAFLHVNKEGISHFNDSYIDLSQNDNEFCQKNPAICMDKDGKYNSQLGNFSAFTKLQNQKKKLKKLISIGGGGDTESFDNALKHIPAFVDSIDKIVRYYHLNGIDLDFEPPLFTPQQSKAYSELIKALRKRLGPKTHILITVTAYQNIDKKNLKKISKHANYIADMCYDFHAYSSSPYTNFDSNLYPISDTFKHISCDQSIKKLIHLGVPRKKIILGYPSFGTLYSGVDSKEKGLFQPFDSQKNEILDEALQVPGKIQYRTIVRLLKTGFHEFIAYYNNKIAGVWAYNPETKQFISYDNPALVKQKATYVISNRLAGLMTWLINYDLPVTDNQSLLKSAHDSLQ